MRYHALAIMLSDPGVNFFVVNVGGHLSHSAI